MSQSVNFAFPDLIWNNMAGNRNLAFSQIQQKYYFDDGDIYQIYIMHCISAIKRLCFVRWCIAYTYIHNFEIYPLDTFHRYG